MHKLFLILLLFLSAVTVCSSARSVQAWQTSEEEIVVLVNHQTIQGIVQRQEDKISVRLSSGSLIVLPNPRVLVISQSLSDAYWELAARTRSTDAKGQIDVYKWCVRNQLFDEAANHLLMLQEMDIPAQTLMQLDVSLQITKKRRLESQQKIVAAPKNIETVPQENLASDAGWQGHQSLEIPNLHDTAPTSPATDRLTTIDEFGNQVDHQIDGNVQQVSWEQPIPENAQRSETLIPDETLRRRLNATEDLSYAALDRLTRSMPKGAVGLFRKQVEPVLQQACASCHQSSASDGDHAFEIFQGRNGAINRRMSQKNLFQVLNLADRQSPEKSQLIRYATSAHGNQSRPSFQWHDAKLNVVKQWLIMVSDDPFLPLEKFAPDRDEKQPPWLATPEAAEHEIGDAKRLPTSSTTSSTTSSPVTLPVSTPEPIEAESVSARQSDPFDANTFNRKFGGR